MDISVVAITAMLNYDRSDVVSVGGIAVVRGRLEPVNDTECERVAAELKHRAVMQNRWALPARAGSILFLTNAEVIVGLNGTQE